MPRSNALITQGLRALDTATSINQFGNRLIQRKQLDENKRVNDSTVAANKSKKLTEDEERRFQSLARDAVIAQQLFKNNDLDGIQDLANERRKRIQREVDAGIAVDTVESDEVLQLVESGDFETLRQRADIIANAAVQQGIIQRDTLTPEAEQQQIRIAQGKQKPTTSEIERLAAARLGENATPAQIAEEAIKIKGELARESSTKVNVSANAKAAEKGAVKEAEKIAEVRANRFDQIQQSALQAEEQNLGLQQIENIDVKTGLGQDAITQVSRAINALGGDGESLTGVNPANVQAFNSITGKLVLDVMSTQKGPQTDKDQARIAKTLPNIGNEELTNQFNINSLKALNFRKIEMAEFFENYLEENETLKGSDRAWAKFKNETPLLSDQVKNADTGLPMFFHEFKTKTLERNPNATEEQIINAWREIN